MNTKEDDDADMLVSVAERPKKASSSGCNRIPDVGEVIIGVVRAHAANLCSNLNIFWHLQKKAVKY